MNVEETTAKSEEGALIQQTLLNGNERFIDERPTHENVVRVFTLNCLTPGIELEYSDLKPIEVQENEEEMAHLVFSGKSRKSGEVHLIRAFNLSSNIAKENYNQAMTVFLRETLRLFALNTELVIQETLEFHENKVCYAIKQVMSEQPFIEESKAPEKMRMVPDENQRVLLPNPPAKKLTTKIQTQCGALRKYLEDPDPFIKAIYLDENSIGDEGARILSTTGWVHLRLLKLSKNFIGDEGAKYLGQNTSWVNLSTLDLSRNSIGVEGAKILSQNTSWFKLLSLDLSDNSIRDGGASYLSKNMSWVNIKVLSLAANKIGDEGAKGLAQNTSWVNLLTLDLSRNSIEFEGAKTLSQNASWVNLNLFDFDDIWVNPQHLIGVKWQHHQLNYWQKFNRTQYEALGKTWDDNHNTKYVYGLDTRIRLDVHLYPKSMIALNNTNRNSMSTHYHPEH